MWSAKVTAVIIIWCCCILIGGVRLALVGAMSSRRDGKVGSNSEALLEEHGSSSGITGSSEWKSHRRLDGVHRSRRRAEEEEEDVDDEALRIFDEKIKRTDFPQQTSSGSSSTSNNNNHQNNNPVTKVVDSGDEELRNVSSRTDGEDVVVLVNDDDERLGGAVNSFKSSISDSTEQVGEEPLEPVTLTPPVEPIGSRGEQEEKILLQYLMRGYERDVRPVRNSSRPVVVEVGITLTQIFDMDEKNQVLTTNVWLDQEWYDELLRWDPAEFNGLESIRLPCERIWLPDIVLYNNADDYTQGYMPSRAMVSHDGKVFWPPPTKFRSTCPVDVTYFPFDDQICTMKLGSWTYNGFQVDVMNRTAEVDLSNYVQNGEWELLEADLQRNVVYYSCCPEPFPDVTITLTIRRKTLYYIYNIVLPCMMLSVLTLLVFCLPPDSGEKIALGITVLLAFSVFMLAIAEKMPETSESIPLIGIYLTAVMAITSVSVVVTVIVLNLHYLGPQVHSVPPWLRRFLPKEKRFRADMSSIRQKSWLIPPTHRDPRSGSLKRSHVLLPPTSRLSIDSYTGGTAGANPGRDHQNLEGADLLMKKPLKECSSTESMTNENAGGNFQKSSGRSSINYHLHPTVHNTTGTTVHQRHHSARHSTKAGVVSGGAVPTNDNNGPTVSDSTVDVSGEGTHGNGGGDVQEDLLRSIRHLIVRQEEVEAQNLMVAEWRLVAQAIDKILFWIFSSVTVVSSAVFLLILPLYKRSWYGPSPPATAQ